MSRIRERIAFSLALLCLPLIFAAAVAGSGEHRSLELLFALAAVTAVVGSATIHTGSTR